MKCRYLAFLCLLLAVSCATPTTFIREPEVEDETLVIGSILLNCQRTDTGAVPIGRYTYNVRLEFEDVATGGKLRATTVDTKGFFYLCDVPGDKIRLKRLAYSQWHAQPDIHKKSSDKEYRKQTNREASTSMTFRRPPVFTVQEGKVNNLGHILWIADLNGGNHDCTYNQEYEETRATFTQKYTNSLWLRGTWVDIRGEW